MPKKRPSKLDDLSDSLSLFLENNPESSIDLFAPDIPMVRFPWADKTFVLLLDDNTNDLINSLNNCRLLPKFTAIWHQDTKDLECIYGVLAPKNPHKNRNFTFNFQGSSYECCYDEPSDRLRNIALATAPVNPPSDTDYRHLIPIRSYYRRLENGRMSESEKEMTVTSFWMRNVNLPEDDLPELARHLNFFMAYCDPMTPRIEIRDEPDEEQIERTLPLIQETSFPENLSGKKLDSVMLSLWESGWTAKDTVRKFLHNYQVIEYAAFYYLKEETTQTIRRLLKAPDISDRSGDVTYQIIDAINAERTQDEHRALAVIQRAVSPENIWAHIQRRLDFFAETTAFDGGLRIEPIIKPDWSLEDFSTAWGTSVPEAIRRIRNCLVHSREIRHPKAILPSSKNRHLLRPWADLTEAVAAEIMLFGAT